MPRMLSWIICCLAAVSVVSGSALGQPLEKTAGSVVEIEVPAPTLEGNLLNSPVVQSAAVYLPPGYDPASERRYPTVYLLHGIFDDYGVWTENYDVQKILDRLIVGEDISELIVVMPNGGNDYGGGYYRNSPVSGNWADYITDDLVGLVDEQFQTVSNVTSRAVVGHSMGGYGALHLAMSKPGVFSVVWALSPCCLSAQQDFGFGNGAWKRAASVDGPADVQSLWDNKDFYAIAFLGVVTAFSPDVNDPPIYGKFPFNVVRGEVVLDDLAIDRYLDELPVQQVHEARDNLRGLRGLALGVGLGDQFLHIPSGTLELSQRLGEARIPHLLDVYDGDHRQSIGERLEQMVFPWVAERLVKQQ